MCVNKVAKFIDLSKQARYTFLDLLKSTPQSLPLNYIPYINGYRNEFVIHTYIQDILKNINDITHAY